MPQCCFLALEWREKCPKQARKKNFFTFFLQNKNFVVPLRCSYVHHYTGRLLFFESYFIYISSLL